MKKIYITTIVVTIAAIAFGLSSCRLHCVKGSGNQISENRKVGNFSKLDISGGYKIILKQDSSLSVKVTADDNLLKYIKTDIDGDVLHIHSKKNMCNTGEMVINIGIRNLEEVKASGAVEVDGDGKINTKDIHFDLSGATKINMDLNAANVVTGISGVTEMNLKGQATSHNIDISGSGKIYALDFVVGSCDIQTSGIGHCEVNVLNSLKVNSSGASDVKYRGNPSNVSNEKSGASSLEKVN